MKDLFDSEGLFGLLRNGKWDEKEFDEVLNWLNKELGEIPSQYRKTVDRLIMVLEMMYHYGDAHDLDLKIENECKIDSLMRNTIDELVVGFGESKPSL